MFFSGSFFKGLSRSHKISYLAVMVALSVVVNFFSFTVGVGGTIKLSFVTTVCLMAGAIFGPIFGFSIAFLGDLLAFLLKPDGSYSPIIGASNGIFAAITGIVFILLRKHNLGIKVGVSSVIAYFMCTVFITSFGIYVYLLGIDIQKMFTLIVYERLISQTPISVANMVTSYLLLKAVDNKKIFKADAS